ncbi:MAG TPA: chemotaxis response regulator protein-glutamate methylesterase [Alphaproteobacteria bacterium]|nr:chemotaxis response regulator protein-glutamate methylesterase [Alphaproteobacteria bacterium]
MNSSAPNPVRIMLVDDSAVIRGGLTALLENDPALKVVASVSNGQSGVDMAGMHKPDIIILDIEMPVMDGLTALPQILQKSPSSKVMMFSTLTERGAQVSMKALSLGAVECLVKPGPGEAKIGSDFHKTLIDKIKHIGGVTTTAAPQASTTAAPLKSFNAPQSFTLRNNPMDYKGKPAILAIGSSTGGPQALFTVLKHLTGLTIPIVITQHMPATFTKILAQHITQQTGLPTFEGEDGMRVEPGKAYVAPGGYHMIFDQDEHGTFIKIDNGPQENFCKPAVDPMLRSLLPIYGRKILCAILTGMGSDGQKGAQMLVDSHARVIAQDQASSVVWGVPGAVSMAGLCSSVLPLNEIGPYLHRAATQAG